MIETPVAIPPAAVHAQATPPAVVGIHFGDPLFNVVSADFMPLDSMGATVILGRVLTLALGQDLLSEDETTRVFGTLRDGVCIIFTRDPRGTIQIIQEEQAPLALLAHCQIGIKTPNGWESVYPRPGIAMAESMDLGRFKLMLAQKQAAQTATITMLTALRKLLNPPAVDIHPGDCPPPAAK